MRPTHALRVAALAPLLALAACGHPDFGPEAADFGNSVKQNIAVQTVNPEPELAQTLPEMDGTRAAIAIGRYQADKVKPPRELRTSDVGR